jgi:chromosome segregation ATPase
MIATPLSVPVSAEISAAEEAARNRVSLLEAEALRFERLIGSQKRELASLDGSLTDLKAQVDLITSMRESVAQEVTDLEDKKIAVSEETKALVSVIEATKAEIAIREDELSGRESDIANAEQILQEAEIASRERSAVIQADEFIVNEKKALISELLTKL